MENTAKAIKDFILDKVNEILPEFEDEEVKLPLLTDKTVIIGVLDPSRNLQNVTCAIVPGRQNDEEGNLAEYVIRSDFTISFVCRNATYDVLIKQMCRYGAAFRKAVLNDYTLNGFAQDIVIGERQFFPDCGTVEKQMTAVETDFSVITAEETE